MNRPSFYTLLAFTGLILLAFVQFRAPVPDDRGDGDGTAADPGAEPGTAGVPGGQSDVDQSLRPLAFQSWPQPAVVLVATGEQQGQLEPCGCTGGQLGGMTRRAGLFRQLQDLGWSVRGLDLGGTVRRWGTQSKLKFETMLQAMRGLQYVALGLGPEELRLDAGYLLSQHLTDTAEPLNFVGANLVFFGAPELGTPSAFRVVDAGGLRIGITSVLSDTLRREVLADAGGGGDIEWRSPDEALAQVLQQMQEAGVTFPILLSQATLDESRAIAERFPAFRIVITAEGFGEGESKAELIGPVRLLQVGEKGRAAGVIGIYPETEEQQVRFELVELSGERFGDDEGIIALLRDYQQRLRDERLTGAGSSTGHPAGAEYVGAARCGECHTQAMQVWQQSAHAHALESLNPESGRDGSERLHGILRDRDPECLACHVTGWDPVNYVRYRSGFMHADLAETADEAGLESLLAGSQCENCHGPGSRHVELIEQGNLQAAGVEVRVTLEQARQTGCVRCHDGDNSPEFDFDTWWEHVAHPGMD
jgi:hypothetical protein